MSDEEARRAEHDSLEFQIQSQKTTLGNLNTRFTSFQDWTKNEIEKLKDLIGGKSLEKKLRAKIKEVEDSVGELTDRLDALGEGKELNEKVVAIEERVVMIEQEINLTAILTKVKEENVVQFVQLFEQKKDEIPVLAELRRELDDVRSAATSRAHDIRCLKFEVQRLKKSSESANHGKADAAFDKTAHPQVAPAELDKLSHDVRCLKFEVKRLRKPAADSDPLKIAREALQVAGQAKALAGTAKTGAEQPKSTGPSPDAAVPPGALDKMSHDVRCLKFEVKRLRKPAADNDPLTIARNALQVAEQAKAAADQAKALAGTAKMGADQARGPSPSPDTAVPPAALP
jgi:hypothetical protein